jgi:hypothetical protein
MNIQMIGTPREEEIKELLVQMDMNSVFLYFIGFVPEIIENIKLLKQKRNEYIQKSH